MQVAMTLSLSLHLEIHILATQMLQVMGCEMADRVDELIQH